MKSFKQLTEELSLSEVDIIGDVVSYLTSVKDTTYESKEEALGEISSIIADLGLTFDMEEAMDMIESGDGTAEIPLKDVGGDEVSLSVFAGESLEDKVEGEMYLKVTSNFHEEGSDLSIDPEIVVYFDDEEAKSLSDIEFDVMDNMADIEKDDEEEDEGEEEEPEEDGEEEEEPLKEAKKSKKKKKDEEPEEEPEPEEADAEEEPVEGEDAPEGEGEEPPAEEEAPDPMKEIVIAKMTELGLEPEEEKVAVAVDYLKSCLDTYLTPKDETGAAPVTDPMATEATPMDDNLEDETSNIEIYEELDLDGGLWNVVMMKPSTRLVISRILHAKDTKALAKILESEYEEFLVLSIDPVLVFDSNKMPSNEVVK